MELRTARTVVVTSRGLADGGRQPSPKPPLPPQLSRRAVLGACLTATGALGSLSPGRLGGSISVEAAHLDVDLRRSGAIAGEMGSVEEQLIPLQQFWAKILARTRSQLGDDFDAELRFYTAQTAAMCAPGDPAKDFGSEGVAGRGGYKGSGMCGKFQPYDDQPYSICDAPGATPKDATAQQCCRHTAYTFIPNKFYVLKSTPAVPVVVMSPRARLLDESTWKAILTHEMGHCVDFFVYGRRYGLVNHPVADPAAATALAAAAMERDPELRADDFANILLSAEVAGYVCYEPTTTLQTLVSPDAYPCVGTMDAGDTNPMLHFTHPPLEGKVPDRL